LHYYTANKLIKRILLLPFKKLQSLDGSGDFIKAIIHKTLQLNLKEIKSANVEYAIVKYEIL